jgi:hypothetical protein
LRRHISSPRSSLASFNSTEQGCILQHHGTAWHPSTPRSSAASFNTTGQRGFLQHYGAAWYPPPTRSSLTYFNTTKQHGILQHQSHDAPWRRRMPHCSMVFEKVALLRGVEGSQAAPWR